jgi:CubicO group peptidase (beta-lactamase class C family)
MSRGRIWSVMGALFPAGLPLAPLAGRSDGAAAAGQPDLAAIDAYVEAQLRDARIPGLALGIVHGDRTVQLQGYGRADDSGRAFTPHTPFFIGSNSKSFTALAVMQLVEAGRIDLDAPVQRYIPWFRVADPAASTQITIRHLLHQTSGLSERAGQLAVVAGPQPLEAAVRALATVQVARPPGTGFEYSNLNYTTLGLVVEVAARERFDRYLQRHIFQPLQMRHTYTAYQDAKGDGLACGYRYWFGFPVAFDQPPPGMLPAGGIISTAEDMTHYLAMYLGGGRYGDQVLLSPAGIAQMLQPGSRQTKGVFAGAGYGMGWFVGPWGGVDAGYHFGDWSHAHAGMALVPRDGWGVIVLFNVGLHGAALPGLLAIEQSVTGLVAGGQAAKATGVRAFYRLFNLAVVAIVAAQGWSLARLLRRGDRLELPLQGSLHTLRQGRRWGLPLVWEFGVAAAVAVVPPKVAKANWKGLFLYGPDMSSALLAIGGLSALTGLIRGAKAGRSLRRRPSTPTLR